MKNISEKRALEIAYKNLYHCRPKEIDKHLDNLLKAKKIVSQNKNSNKDNID